MVTSNGDNALPASGPPQGRIRPLACLRARSAAGAGGGRRPAPLDLKSGPWAGNPAAGGMMPAAGARRGAAARARLRAPSSRPGRTDWPIDSFPHGRGGGRCVDGAGSRAGDSDRGPLSREASLRGATVLQSGPGPGPGRPSPRGQAESGGRRRQPPPGPSLPEGRLLLRGARRRSGLRPGRPKKPAPALRRRHAISPTPGFDAAEAAPRRARASPEGVSGVARRTPGPAGGPRRIRACRRRATSQPAGDRGAPGCWAGRGRLRGVAPEARRGWETGVARSP